MNNLNAVSQSFRCPHCDTLFNSTLNFEQNLTTCSEKFLFEERITNPRNSLWQAGSSTLVNQTFQKISNIRLWINLFPRRDLQRHKYNNLDRETCPNICINFFTLCGRTNFPLQLWPSSPPCIFYWSSWKFSFPKQSERENLFLDIKTTIKIKLGSVLEILTQRHIQWESATFDMSQDDCDNETCPST